MESVVVSGALANKYMNGGAAWTRLSWILGFKRLGFRTYFVEQIGDAGGGRERFEGGPELAFFRHVTGQFGLAEDSALIYQDARGLKSYGMSYDDVLDAASGAAALINITGHLSLVQIKRLFRRKVYVDLDPGYTQFWHASGNAGPRLAGHDYYFTVGENVGTPACEVPAGGLAWRPVRQPVLLEHWPVSREGDPRRFTTIASWRGPYGPAQYGGRSFGLKVHEFRKFIEIPRRAGAEFEIALDIHPAEVRDLEMLREYGWRLVPPRAVAGDPEAFRSYVQNSGAEFSVAQGIYVETKSGWFSDRTTRYLASGKPALVQDTGFNRDYLENGAVVAFATLDEAVRGAEAIARDYKRRCSAARALAEEFFDSDKVLGLLVNEISVSP